MANFVVREVWAGRIDGGRPPTPPAVNVPDCAMGLGIAPPPLTGVGRCSFSVLMPPHRIPEDTAAYARWLADRIEERGERSPTRLSPAAAMFVGMALRGYARLLDGREAAEMLFTVSFEDGRDVRIQAACRAGEVAWAAYHLTIAAFPDRHIVLRHSGRMIGEHGGAAGREPALLTSPVDAGRHDPS